MEDKLKEKVKKVLNYRSQDYGKLSLMEQDDYASLEIELTMDDNGCSVFDYIEALQAENKRLKEALEEKSAKAQQSFEEEANAIINLRHKEEGEFEILEYLYSESGMRFHGAQFISKPERFKNGLVFARINNRGVDEYVSYPSLDAAPFFKDGKLGLDWVGTIFYIIVAQPPTK